MDDKGDDTTPSATAKLAASNWARGLEEKRRYTKTESDFLFAALFLRNATVKPH